MEGRCWHVLRVCPETTKWTSVVGRQGATVNCRIATLISHFPPKLWKVVAFSGSKAPCSSAFFSNLFPLTQYIISAIIIITIIIIVTITVAQLVITKQSGARETTMFPHLLTLHRRESFLLLPMLFSSLQSGKEAKLSAYWLYYAGDSIFHHSSLINFTVCRRER